MTDQKIMMECDTCSKKFQFGPHQYEGRVINLYGITVCDTCWTGNWDGWASHFEPIIQKHLAEKNLPEPPRNNKGWLPRD